jgi:hypothetical protein
VNGEAERRGPKGGPPLDEEMADVSGLPSLEKEEGELLNKARGGVQGEENDARELKNDFKAPEPEARRWREGKDGGGACHGAHARWYGASYDNLLQRF